jgi:TolB-like protein
VAPGDDAYLRRIAAVLVAERDATGAAESAEAALALLRVAGGDVERIAADTVVAGFDRPQVAVAAANRLHRETPATWRAGIHVAEIIMTDEGTETRDAIERATTLARLARPGTTAVAATAFATIGPVHEATIEALGVTAENIDGIVHLLVPIIPAPPSLQRRRLVAALAGAALVGGGAAVWITWRRLGSDDAPRHVTLGVGPFHLPRTDPEHEWIGTTLRTGLTTQLSELSGVKVYSQGFIDFLMSREKLSEIEVASRLGIEKMLTGNVLVVGDSVRVEAQIMNVASGLIEGGYWAVRPEDDFLALENELVLGIIGKLDLALSPDDERRLATRRATNLDVFRRFLDSERPSAEPPSLPPSKEGEKRDPSSFLPSPRVAYADDARAEIAALLEEYRRALEAHDVSALATMYLTFVPEQRSLLERYFTSVRDLKVRIADVDVAVVGDEAVVSYTRIDDFVDIALRRPQHLSIRATRTLRRVNGRWRFASTQ